MFDWRRPLAGRRGEVVAETKESRSGPLIAFSHGGRARWTPRDYAHLAAEGFGKNAVAYRCVRMIAEGDASVPLAVFADGGRAADHPLARLLAKPNPEQSGAAWLEGLYGALQTAGNAYVEATGDGDGDGAPDELWALRPDRMK
ncbi:MAG: phage portal protein, partial [Alphaproteobacteria bacterium]